ncbi:MAG: NAD(P)H-hydrate dehydratase [Scardovia wiggsiae]|uniref:ADP-dependent NAD(P)H-hydrate dehydratase n=1 Tax=Scardovia wiggsiae TaxID=230143 RepID=UPI001CB0FFCD|nr:NAD(P)H-hydrate dehydratase [Scardovia wiggsiae]
MLRSVTLADISGAVAYPGPGDSKYTRGVVGLITGSDKYPGAAVLGVTAAAKAGAGYIRYMGTEYTQQLVLQSRPESVMGIGPGSHIDAWVIGSGMADTGSASVGEARHEAAEAVLDACVGAGGSSAGTGGYCVIDAGALPYFTQTAVRCAVPGAGSVWNAVVTPHAGEAVSMLGICGYDADRTEVEGDPGKYAVLLAQKLGCGVVLKGSPTVIFSPDAPYPVCLSATHWLATAGTGDVLAGIMGTLLAQNSEAISKGEKGIQTVAAAAVFIHSLAAGLASEDDLSVERLFSGDMQKMRDNIRQDKQGRESGRSTQEGHPITAMDVCAQIPSAVGLVLSRKQGRG